MPYADKEKRAEYNKTYNKQWYEDNKQKRSEQVKEQKRRKKKEWDAFKASVECAHCGTSGRPEVIDFHHVDKDDPKNKKVYKFVQGDNYSMGQCVRSKSVAFRSARIATAPTTPKNLPKIKTDLTTISRRDLRCVGAC
jgi:ribosomal protein L32